MGQYINYVQGTHIGTTFKQKCQSLQDKGAKEDSGHIFKPNLICVVDNGLFAAAAYCFSEQEFKAFKEDTSGRPKRWFVLEDAAKYVD